jgi:hypothetical protein
VKGILVRGCALCAERTKDGVTSCDMKDLEVREMS